MDDDAAVPGSEKSSTKEADSIKSESVEGEATTAPSATVVETVVEEKKKPSVVEKEEEEPQEVQEVKDEQKIISLDDLEESIRKKIEAKLEEDEESYEPEEDKEFENLSSYLLGAAARVQKYTAEALGYRIFKRYMRQEVPGIGPYVETEQVEKVVEFMDFWSHKQEQLVMPRNIRHWMCPPLDKIPTPEP